ncbi:MAG: hypothetical protein IJ877_05690 [Candidatus Gastranaerophilales bacterium]|nr:hypothetical protein [Candidatus Gastranaerophilales bacterium]
MMMKYTNKKTAFRVFQMLDRGFGDKDEIIENLQIGVSTFYKSIQKLKDAGFNIKKQNNFYSLERYKHILFLDNKEKSVVAYMLNTAYKFLPKYKYKSFQSFVKKFLLLASEVDYNEIAEKFQLIKKYSLIDEYEEKFNTIEFFILQKEPVKVTLHSNRIIFMTPLRFDWKQEKSTLYYKNIMKEKEEKITLEQIAKIEGLDEEEYTPKRNEIIFELYGNLAKRYLLKKEERVIKAKKDSLVIASGAKDKEALFKRLLRYDTLCKVLFPKTEVNSFNKLIDKAIMNINSEG